jgi:hypothetical protein
MADPLRALPTALILRLGVCRSFGKFNWGFISDSCSANAKTPRTTELTRWFSASTAARPHASWLMIQ